jgi:hypothetical protein
MPPRVQKLKVTSIEAKRGTPQWKWVGANYYGRADASRNLIVFRDYSPGHFAHELGHLLWPLMTREQAAEIQAEFADHSSRAPQDYGRRNVWEFFSDVFRGVFAPGSFQGWGSRLYYGAMFERWGWGPGEAEPR